jgi:hypothetical protein
VAEKGGFAKAELGSDIVDNAAGRCARAASRRDPPRQVDTESARPTTYGLFAFVRPGRGEGAKEGACLNQVGRRETFRELPIDVRQHARAGSPRSWSAHKGDRALAERNSRPRADCFRAQSSDARRLRRRPVRGRRYQEHLARSRSGRNTPLPFVLPYASIIFQRASDPKKALSMLLMRCEL